MAYNYVSHDFVEGQNYDQIKSDCLKSGELFEDDFFPADDSSIYRIENIFKKKYPDLVISWKRPHEFLQDKTPEFIVDSVVPEDIDQGKVGDCWFIAGLAAVATKATLFEHVCPPDQSFNQGDYCGIFKFRFFLPDKDREGDWAEIVVDDRLPVDQNDQLVYCHNQKDNNEMFGPLLEKAYAKFKVCYEFLWGGYPIEAIMDLTGGVYQRLRDGFIANLPKIPDEKLWEIIFKALNMEWSSLGGVWQTPRAGQKQEGLTSNGLITGHAYSVLAVYELCLGNDGIYNSYRDKTQKTNPNNVRILKIRNPWGSSDYKGQWNKNDTSWKKISPEIIANIGDVVEGEFFMSYKDFAAYFDNIGLVHYDMNAFYANGRDYYSNFSWGRAVYHGAWIKGQTAGGQFNNNDAFFTNPQFPIWMGDTNQRNQVSIVLYLRDIDGLQNQLNRKKKNSIFLSIYKVKDGHKKAEGEQYSSEDLEWFDPPYVWFSFHSVSYRLEVVPGDYVLIPSTYDKDQEGRFYIDLFYEAWLDKNDPIYKGYDCPPDEVAKINNNNASQPSFLQDFQPHGRGYGKTVSKACLIM